MCNLFVSGGAEKIFKINICGQLVLTPKMPNTDM